ncbi:MAG: ABC transporter ATP-binding protein [Exilispira sp.]
MRERKAQTIILKIIKKNWLILVISILIMMINTVIGIYFPVIIKNSIDENIMKGNIAGLEKDAIIFFLLLIILSILTFFSIFITEIFGQKFLFDLKQDIFSHILYAKIKIFDIHPVGRLISRIESDGESLREFFTNSVISILSDILLCIGMIAVLLRFSYNLTLLILPVIFAIFLFSFWYQKSVSPFWVNLRKINSQLFGFFSDFLRGNQILKIFHKKPWAFQKINLTIEKKYKNEIRGELLDSLYYNSLQIFEALSISLILWFGGLKSISSKMTIGTIILFVTYIKQFFGPIRNLSSQFQIFQKAFASINRINDVFDMEIENVTDGEIATFNSDIAFSKLSFSYKYSKDENIVENITRVYSGDSEQYFTDITLKNSRKYAVENLNFTIRKGEKIGIVGRTGCGKTTIASLLLKFYEDYEGSIKIDGKELKELSHQSIRSIIGAVFQDTFLFADTILNNIILGKNLTVYDVKKAIEELGVKSVFDSFPDGLNTQIKEDGTNLSSGEKQIIALVRVYINNPEIFILDEATSSIDNKTESIIYDALKKILQNRTAIIIAHRLSTIEFCDRILCFHKGKLIEEGKKDELLGLNGYFAKLYQSYKKIENL